MNTPLDDLVFRHYPGFHLQGPDLRLQDDAFPIADPQLGRIFRMDLHLRLGTGIVESGDVVVAAVDEEKLPGSGRQDIGVLRVGLRFVGGRNILRQFAQAEALQVRR